MTDVFISYSRKDKAFVQRLNDALTKAGRDIWVDWEDIPLTSDWWQEIRSGIEAANTFVFVMTPDSMSSAVCNLEVAHATACGKRIVPVVLKDTDTQTTLDTIAKIQPDDILRGMLHGRDLLALSRVNLTTLGHINWVFFRSEDDFDKSFQKLITIFDTDIEHVHEHTRLLVRAKEWDYQDRNTSFLITGDELHAAQNWLSHGADKKPQPTELHATYILESGRNEQRRQRRVLLGVSVAMVVAIALSMLSLILFIQAQESEAEALDKGTLAAEQAELAVNNEGTALARGTEAAEQAELAQNNEGTALARGTEAAEQAELAVNNESTALARGTEAAEQAELAQNNEATAVVLVTEVAEQVVIAERQAAEARSIALSANARLTFQQNEPLALRLALEALNIDDPPEIIAETIRDLGLERGATKRYSSPLAVSQADMSADGKLVVITSFTDNKIALVDLETGQRLWQVDDIDAVDVAFNSDASVIALASQTNGILMVDVQSGEIIRQMSGDAVAAVDFSPDDTQIVNGEGSFATVWDVNSGELVASVQDSRLSLTDLVFHPNGEQVFLADVGGELFLWDIPSNEIIREFNGHTEYIRQIIVNADGSQLISASSDKRLIRWDVETGEVIREYQGHSSDVSAVALSADERRMVSGGDDKMAIVWDVESGDIIAQLHGHSSLVRFVEFLDAKTILSGGFDSSFVFWDLNNRRQIGVYDDIHSSGIWAAAVSNDGRLAVSADTFDNVALWNLENFTLEGIAQLSAKDIELSPNSSEVYLSSGLWDDPVRVIGIADGSIIRNMDLYGHSVNVIELSPDGNYLIGGTIEGLVAWNSQTGEVVWTTDEDKEFKIISISPDGENVLVVAEDGYSIGIKNIDNGELIDIIESPRLLSSIDISPDGRFVAAGTYLNTVLIFDMETHEVIQTLFGHEQSIYSVTYHPDGDMLASTSQDTQIILWDTTTGQIFDRLKGHDAQVNFAVFSPDGKTLLSGGNDERLILWDVSLSFDEQLAWICANRLFEIGIAERDKFGISSRTTVCDSVESLSGESQLALNPEDQQTTRSDTSQPTPEDTPRSVTFDGEVVTLDELASGFSDANVAILQYGDTVNVELTGEKDAIYGFFEASEGDVITITSQGNPSHPFIVLLDERFETLADGEGTGDTITNFAIPEDGTYIILLITLDDFDEFEISLEKVNEE